LGEVERLLPLKTALGKHFEHRVDAFRIIQAADCYEDRPRKTLQVVGKHPGAAIGAEVPIQPLARIRDVVKRLRLATDKREIMLRHTEVRSCFAARSLFAVQAVTDRDERRIGAELELDRAACAKRPSVVAISSAYSSYKKMKFELSLALPDHSLDVPSPGLPLGELHGAPVSTKETKMLRTATLLASLLFLVSTFIGPAAEAFPAPAPAAASPAVQTPGKTNLAERDKSEAGGGVIKREQHHAGPTLQQPSGS
jgi:hypothetical protein